MKKKLRLYLVSIALLFVVFFLYADIASAVNIDVSPGDDIQAALDSANSGDTVRLSEGTYNASGFIVDYSITIEGGWNSDFTERDIDAYETIIISTDYGFYGHVMDLGWWKVDGLTLIGNGVGVGIENCCDDITISNCRISGFAEGVLLCGWIRNIVENCIIENNTIRGVHLCHEPAGIYKSIIRGNGVGIEKVDCCGDVDTKIISCTIIENDVGVKCEVITPECYPEIVNSIITGNTSAMNYDIPTLVAANLLRNSNVEDPAIDGTNDNINADPLFTDAANGDYSLKSNSSCIDAGAEVMLHYGLPVNDYVPLDFSGAAPEMGAIEVLCNGAGVTGTVSPSTDTLWPPNHSVIPVSIDASGLASSNPDTVISISSVDIVETSSQEAGEAYGENVYDENNYEPDVEITGDLSLNLRAERTGASTGRTYVITVTATDCSGSYDFTAEVSVPHDKK
jgi:hypothetical protein